MNHEFQLVACRKIVKVRDDVFDARQRVAQLPGVGRKYSFGHWAAAEIFDGEKLAEIAGCKGARVGRVGERGR